LRGLRPGARARPGARVARNRISEERPPAVMRNGSAANLAPAASADVPAAARRSRQGRLFRKYLLLILTLVSGALLASGAISVYFSYQEHKFALGSLQQEKAIAAASRIEQYIRQIEQQLAYAALPQLDASDVELRRIEFLKLLRQVPEVTDIMQLDGMGREQVLVSRLGMDVIGSGKDRSQEPAFRGARKGQPWVGPVYFRKETEPYMTVAVRSGSDGGPVTIAEVKLQFIWDVVSRIKIGDKGKASVVDRNGFLVADPDIGLVLRKTNLSELPHVQAAMSPQGFGDSAVLSRDLTGTQVLVSMAPIESLDWKVFVEQPVSEVYARLYASILRTGLLLLAGLVISALGAMALARGMVRPIRTLSEGAQRIGEGDLDQKIVVRTGDELEALADRFNRMSGQLKESYAGLERKVEVRTHELTNSLEQQTAISEILRVISNSPTDVQPVLDAVAERAALLCSAPFSRVMLVDGDLMRPAASSGVNLIPTVPVPLSRTSLTGRAVIDRETIHVADVLPLIDSEFPDARDNMVNFDCRAVLAVPLMREGGAYGGIFIARHEPGLFPPDQVALVQTFARQAAIAIDNVRLFNETKEALAKQTAISEILRVISSSPTDVQPVLETIAERAAQLCDAAAASIYLTDGDVLRHLASRGPTAEPVSTVDTLPINRDSTSGRSLLERRTIHVADMLAEAAEYPLSAEIARRSGHRTILVMPLLREGQPFGSIVLRRHEVRPFSDQEIALLRTFGDQAAIAHENVRLFREIQDKSRELEIANKHKSAFLASMSHELRTPLNAIIGFSEVLLARFFGELNVKQDDYLNDIHSSGRHLLNLINDVLDLSKVEAGKMELDLSQFSLPAALGDAMTLIRERATKHGIALGLDVAPALGTVTGDERKFKQILLNLLSNAVKFTPDGGSVDVSAVRQENDILVAVKDTGIGIALADQEAVFEEFRQVGGDYTRKQEGTGLGLALTRSFVELHGGRIWVESTPGKGSIFFFTLPDRS
jgi:signal transduction histidine kinase